MILLCVVCFVWLYLVFVMCNACFPLFVVALVGVGCFCLLYLICRWRLLQRVDCLLFGECWPLMLFDCWLAFYCAYLFVVFF